MVRRTATALLSFLLLASGLALYGQNGTARAQQIIERVLTSNEAFMKAHGPTHFKPLVEGQHPQITLITCSDSRVQMHALDAMPDGEVFVIRDIGNQLATCEGSVEYGVRHLHTPVLLIVGHVRCGAVKAAMGNYFGEPPAIRKELGTLKLKKGGNWLDEVRANVNAQVKAAMALFGEEIKAGTLTVIGAVYDFADDLKQGSGRLVVININGDTSPAKIHAFLAPTKK